MIKPLKEEDIWPNSNPTAEEIKYIRDQFVANAIKAKEQAIIKENERLKGFYNDIEDHFLREMSAALNKQQPSFFILTNLTADPNIIRFYNELAAKYCLQIKIQNTKIEFFPFV